MEEESNLYFCHFSEKVFVLAIKTYQFSLNIIFEVNLIFNCANKHEVLCGIRFSILVRLFALLLNVSTEMTAKLFKKAQSNLLRFQDCIVNMTKFSSFNPQYSFTLNWFLQFQINITTTKELWKQRGILGKKIKLVISRFMFSCRSVVLYQQQQWR